MNDLEKLIYLHDPRGDAATFLLTKEEMQEFINAAIAVGQEDAPPCECDVTCDECGFRDAGICVSCAEDYMN